MSEFLEQSHLILASGSPNRAKLLNDAGLDFDIIPSDVDESEIKDQHVNSDFHALARVLAEAKGANVSLENPDAIIIAADQICVFEQQVFDKPLSFERAVEQLQTLQGQTHQLISAVCLYKNGQNLWSHVEQTILTMRPLVQEQIQNYLKVEMPLHSCGSYHFEGRGRWIFSEVTSDESTIIGLPMQPLINQLIELGLVKIFHH